MGRPPIASQTSARILDIAERLVQTRGFNGFSYADIAEMLNVTKASLHYHFPTKAALGAGLINRYNASFLSELARIDETSANAKSKLRAYTEIYIDVLENGGMCMCGMLGAEYATLPQEMQTAVRGFFDANEVWLVETLSSGRRKQQLAFAGQPVEVARLLVSALQGGMLVARTRQDASLLRSVVRRLLAEFAGKLPKQETPPTPEAAVANRA